MIFSKRYWFGSTTSSNINLTPADIVRVGEALRETIDTTERDFEYVWNGTKLEEIKVKDELVIEKRISPDTLELDETIPAEAFTLDLLRVLQFWEYNKFFLDSTIFEKIYPTLNGELFESIGTSIDGTIYSLFNLTEVEYPLTSLDVRSRKDLIKWIKFRHILRKFSSIERSILRMAEDMVEYFLGMIFQVPTNEVRETLSQGQWIFLYVPILPGVKPPVKFRLLKEYSLPYKDSFGIGSGWSPMVGDSDFSDIRLRSSLDKPVRGVLVYCDSEYLLERVLTYLNSRKGVIIPSSCKIYGLTSLWTAERH